MFWGFSMTWFYKLAVYDMTIEQAYDFIGLRRGNVSEMEFKQKYNQLAFEYHPDRNPENVEQATEDFKQLQHAAELVTQDISSGASRNDPGAAGGPQVGAEWYETQESPTDWAAPFQDQLRQHMGKYWNDYLDELQSDTNAWLEDASPEAQEDHAFDFAARSRNADAYDEHIALLVDPRNKPAPLEYWADELALDRYSQLKGMFKAVKHWRAKFSGDPSLDRWNNDLIRWLQSGGQGEVPFLWNLAARNSYGTQYYGAPFDINMHLYDDMWGAFKEAGREGDLAAPRAVKELALARLQKLVQNSILWGEVQPVDVGPNPSAKIRDLKVKRFADYWWKRPPFVGEHASNYESPDELANDIGERLGFWSGDDWDEPGIQKPYKIWFTDLRNVGFVLDKELEDFKQEHEGAIYQATEDARFWANERAKKDPRQLG